eukprot:SAG25_NODE_2647_length_1471_cov_12.493440_3_plen_92_part_01
MCPGATHVRKVAVPTAAASALSEIVCSASVPAQYFVADTTEQLVSFVIYLLGILRILSWKRVAQILDAADNVAIPHCLVEFSGGLSGPDDIL